MSIAISKDEWARIMRWTNPNEDTSAQRRNHLRYLEEASREMTKTWPNSLENVNKRNEEVRRARAEAAERANTEFYKEYVRSRREEQRRLMDSARDIVFKHQDAPKMLLSAVIETVIQKERQEQVKFNKELRNQKERRSREEDEEIIKRAREWHEREVQRKKERFEVNKHHQKEIIEQANEISERNRKEYEDELNFQKIDNIKAKQQIDAIKQFEEDLKAAEKARIWSDMERSKREVEARRQERAAREELDDQLQRLLLRAGDRVERRRRATEDQIKKEKLLVLEKISQNLETGDAARDAAEQAILKKAIDEKEAIAEARRQASVEKQAQSKQQRIDARKKFLEEEEQRLQDFNTMRQWEIMNRFKNAELYDDFKEKLRQEKAQKTQEYREDILKQWKEREETEAAEREVRRLFYGPQAERQMRAADQRVLAHGQLLIQEARRHGRPDHALHRALDRYCRLHRLHALPPLPAALAKHFPHYQPEDRCLNPHTLEEQGKRDGLQLPDVIPTKTDDQRDETRDYIRAGPANGLQRRND